MTISGEKKDCSVIIYVIVEKKSDSNFFVELKSLPMASLLEKQFEI